MRRHLRDIPALLRAIAIGRRRETLKDTTLQQYLYDLDRRLDRILTRAPQGEPGRKLHKRMLANRAHLLVFMTNRSVPYCQHVRMTSIQIVALITRPHE